MLHRLHAHAVLIVGIIILVMGSLRPALALPVSSGARLAIDQEAGTSLLQKVHGWHCSRRYGWALHRHGRFWHEHPRWHRHRRACYSRGYYYGPYVYYRYPRIYRRYHRRRIVRRHIRKRRIRRARIYRHRRLRRHRVRIRRGGFRRRASRGFRRGRRGRRW